MFFHHVFVYRHSRCTLLSDIKLNMNSHALVVMKGVFGRARCRSVRWEFWTPCGPVTSCSTWPSQWAYRSPYTGCVSSGIGSDLASPTLCSGFGRNESASSAPSSMRRSDIGWDRPYIYCTFKTRDVHACLTHTQTYFGMCNWPYRTTKQNPLYECSTPLGQILDFRPGDRNLPGRADRFLICRVWLMLPGGGRTVCMIYHCFRGWIYVEDYLDHRHQSDMRNI